MEQKNLTFVGWVILIGMLVWFNKTKFGHNLIYLSLSLILLVLVLGQYQAIQNISFKQEEK